MLKKKVPELWTPEFINNITIDGHYLGDSCGHKWDRTTKLYKLYARYYHNYLKTVTCSSCGRKVVSNKPNFTLCRTCKANSRHPELKCLSCGRKSVDRTRVFPYCLECRNSIKEATIAIEKPLVIFEMRIRGTSFKKIGEYFGVSKQRAYQLYLKGERIVQNREIGAQRKETV